MTPEISILIITHNQRPLLERCLESVLKQEIKVPYEIIVSDDRSTDGTDEYVTSLSQSSLVSLNKELVGLYYLYCNTDEFSPVSTGQRIGWNRLNAYQHAKGKYFVNVDSDDFLVGTSLYQSEYDILESHPECVMVQTRTLMLDEGESIDNIRACYPFSEKLVSGTVFSLEDVLQNGLRGQHQSYMYRRRPQDNMSLILGSRFDDINITYYHLQFGPVFFLDTTGYVWMQHPDSDSHSRSTDDRKVAYGLIPLSLSMLFRDSKYVFLKCGVRKLWVTIATAPKYPDLSDRIRKSFSLSKAFIYRYYAENHHGLYSWSRYWFVFTLLLLMKRLRLHSKCWLDLLYRGMV